MKTRSIIALFFILSIPASFAESLDLIKKNGKYGFMDQYDKIVIPTKFEYAENFSEGLAVVKIKDKYGYINETGNIIIPNDYDFASSFNEKGIATVKRNNKYGCIDKTGAIVIPIDYDLIGTCYRGFTTAKKDGKIYYVSFYTGEQFQSYDTAKKAQAEKEMLDRDYKHYMLYKLPTYEAYLNSNGIKPMTNEYLRIQIEKEIGEWQKKGEFETTAQWQARVNEQTRATKAKEIGGRITTEYNNKLQKISSEYRAKYDAISKEYCDYHSLNFVKQDFELKPYDADNQTFLISTERFGDILLPVPLAEAPDFKSRWESLKQSVQAQFIPAGDDIALHSVSFGPYTYTADTQASYAQVDVDYNFRPIDVADLAFNFEKIDNISDTPVQPTTPSGISRRKYEPKRRHIAVGDASDVDTNIPQGTLKAPNSFAVVIANGNYAHASRVANAENDGRTMERYLNRTLGIPEKNITTYIDATYGQMASAMSHLRDVAEAYGSDNFNVIFYYVGHGLPDEQNRESYVLPVDVDPRNTEICYPLTKLYSQLGNLGARNVTVMVDACFSGANHGDGMLIPQAMSVVVKPKTSSPVGNMIVMSAAEGDETAFPYASQGHGLFTYWLLKKLQETKGDVTIGELNDFVTENVKKISVVENRKRQTPTISISPTLGSDWRSMPFGR